MFSPLARGKAGWDGGLQCEEYSEQTVRHKLLFFLYALLMSKCLTRAVKTFQTIYVAINNDSQKLDSLSLSIVQSNLKISRLSGLFISLG